jgi:hypothetical protein
MVNLDWIADRTPIGQDLYCVGIALYQLATGDPGLVGTGNWKRFCAPVDWQKRRPTGWSWAGWDRAVRMISACLSLMPSQRPPAYQLLVEEFGLSDVDF